MRLQSNISLADGLIDRPYARQTHVALYSGEPSAQKIVTDDVARVALLLAGEDRLETIDHAVFVDELVSCFSPPGPVRSYSSFSWPCDGGPAGENS